jgi:ABC-2 type transport system ATP-binding protein
VPPPPDQHAASPAVEVQNLVKRFDGFTAVDDVSFSVAPGELFGFLGPNGAGKTTTISILCTLLSPSAGRATVAGWDVVTHANQVRRDIGLVFQELTLDEYLTAEENLQFHAVMYGVPRHELRERLTPLLDMVGLTERRNQQVRLFSGGMKRRLEIARGLVHMPRVLFLDEPTIGLDPQTRTHIWDYIDELRGREATTMFLTTHYMDEAERCDRIAIIDQGRIVAIDTPDALKASVGKDTLTLTTTDDEVAADELAARLGVTTERRNGTLVAHVADGEAFVPKLFDVLSVGVRSVSVRRPSLDDVFIRYTGRAIRDAEAGGVDQLKASPMIRSFRKN